MDVIGSGPGPERPPGRLDRAVRAARRWLPADGRRRRSQGLLALLLAAGLVAALRGGLPEGRSGADQAWSAPWVRPYDTLPGRTPIPAPSLVSEDGRVVQGNLPLRPSYDGDRVARRRAAVAMVLGRYCRRPQELAITFTPDGPGVGDVATVSDRRTGRFIATIVLYAAGTETADYYQWRGWLEQLRNC